MSYRGWQPNPPCELCGFGGDSEGPWLQLRSRYCRDCQITHVLCKRCPEDFGLNHPFTDPWVPLARCPNAPEIQVMLAVLGGG